jgi:hypothetical protein
MTQAWYAHMNNKKNGNWAELNHPLWWVSIEAALYRLHEGWRGAVQYQCPDPKFVQSESLGRGLGILQHLP